MARLLRALSAFQPLLRGPLPRAARSGAWLGSEAALTDAGSCSEQARRGRRAALRPGRRDCLAGRPRGGETAGAASALLGGGESRARASEAARLMVAETCPSHSGAARTRVAQGRFSGRSRTVSCPALKGTSALSSFVSADFKARAPLSLIAGQKAALWQVWWWWCSPPPPAQHCPGEKLHLLKFPNLFKGQEIQFSRLQIAFE